MTRQQGPDRRVQRTQRALRAALHSLIREKSYDSIPVQEILNRADVGRSTFYTHYRDKDELLASSIHDLLNQARAAAPGFTQGRIDRILSFSLPIFVHIDRHRRIGEELVGTGDRAILHDHLRNVLAERIADELRKDSERGSMAVGKVPSELLIQYLASTLVLVLNWWVETKSRLAPEEVNDLFRSLVLPALAPTSR